MKLFTFTIATICLLTASAAVFAQESVANEVNTAPASIKFNPINIANGVLKVKMYNQPKGIYTIQIMDATGKTLANKTIQHINGAETETADFGKTFNGGTYQVEVIAPGNTKTHETIMLLI